MSLETEILAAWKDLTKSFRLSPVEKRLVAQVAADAAELHIEVLGGTMTAAAAGKEKAQLDAQLANLKSIAGARAQRLFWQAFNTAASVITKAILAA